ncbi:MAG TPA: class I tRNA ligase family protein, partial [Acetobacteraceae bacterium]|nr:class I tRNA ligase family protein [Acetobacteraceae bacterium]
PGPAANALLRQTHRTIAAVTEALEGFAFNVAVARLHEFANALAEAERRPADDADAAGLPWMRLEALRVMARLIAPMMPHLAEEMHARLVGDGTLVAELPWPESDPALAAAETVTIAVQVMGKLRGTLSLPPGSKEAEVLAAAEADPNVARAMAGRRIVKRIYVPDRIVNFVVAG